MDRIFTACQVTQLLVIVHLRRHLPPPSGRDFLIWHAMDDNPRMDAFMRAVIATAGFADSLDMRDFEALKPRTQGPWQWWLEAPRRLRADAAVLHGWMARNRIAVENAELWADEPMHFNVVFARGMLRGAHHVKIPHCFNLEDAMSPQRKSKYDAKWRDVPPTKKYIYNPWLRRAAGMDMRIDRVGYERAYTFAAPSPWSATSVDVSAFISMDAFADTYNGLPDAMRAEVEAILAPIRESSRPLLLLLPCGFGPNDHAIRNVYESTMARVFSERKRELEGCSLAVKWHPGASDNHEPILVDWLRRNIPAHIHEIRHPLNLEFMLPQLRPDYVLAGLCGSLRIVRELGVGKAVVPSELFELDLSEHPERRQVMMMEFISGIEVW